MPFYCVFSRIDALLLNIDGFNLNLVASAASVKADLSSEFAGVKLAQAELETRVKQIEDKQVKFDDVQDSSAAAITLARKCDPYELVFCDFPDIPVDLIPDALRELGKPIDVRFTTSCVVETRRAPPPRPALDAAGDSADARPGGAVSVSRPPELFVEFRFARLRDLFLTQMRTNTGGGLTYPGVSQGTKVRCYEVLLPDHQTLFRDIRAAADPKEISVWHYDGFIKGRIKDGGKPIYFNHVTDLDKLKKMRRD